MKNNFLQNDARAIMTYDFITLINKLNLFYNKKSIVNIGSFDLIEYENIDLGLELLSSLKLKIDDVDLTKYIENKRISSKVLWEKLGFDNIVFIDSDGVHNSLAFDFNLDIHDELNFHRSFDVVTNFGTSEHIFNQYAVFKNIHKLCNKDGLMIHSLPIQGAYEHGLYNYQPNLFLALANANDYKIEYFGVRHEELDDFKLVEIDSELINPFLKNIDAHDTLAIFIVLRKMSNQDFKVPFQGRYEVHKKNTK